MTGVLDRAVDYLANRLDRRGFLGRTAVVGSAIVAAPLEFGLRPKSAYAAVCRCSGSSCACGSLCCDGYTEFCCTLNGINACPPGTITAGWWKVDGSQFCGGAARYYLDCNAQCGGCSCGGNGICSGSCSGTPCGCGSGSCGNRKSGCTRFRYGQCNQHVRCVGPIVCRVVTCAPPWQFDPACGTSSRTDNATRNHDRPCLHEPEGVLESVTDGGGSVRVRGWAVSASNYAQAVIRLSIDGATVVEVLANKPRPDVQFGAPAFGPNTGFDFSWPAKPGRRVVCAHAIDRRTGRVSFIGFREISVAAPRGKLERVDDLGNGRLRVTGWATDPAFPGGAATIRYRVDGREVRRAATNVERPSVPRVVPGANPRSGFSEVVTVPSGRRSVCVDVINRYGHAHQLGCWTVDVVPTNKLEGVADLGGGRVRVHGWATDPSAPGSRAMVRYRLDGAEVHRGLTSVARPSVVDAVPGAHPQSGFSVELNVPTGRGTICVDVLNSDGSVIELGCRQVDVVPANKLERVLSVGGGRVSIGGWATDPTAPGTRAMVRYRVDGVEVHRAVTAVARPSVTAAVPGAHSQPGFAIELSIGAGPRTVCIDVLNSDGSTVEIGCRSLNVRP